MKSKFFGHLGIVLLIMGVVFALTLQPQEARAQEKFKLKFQATWPAGSSLFGNFKEFTERVKAMSAGRLEIEALPAGAVIWLVSNVQVGGLSLAAHAVDWLDPIGLLLGLNGVILLAFVVAIPANEIVIPTVLMLTVLTAPSAGTGAGAGVMFELESVAATGDLLRAGGWTLLTAVSLMLFSLLHNPCSTTIYTIYKETRSAKWTTLATLLPLGMGVVVCFLVTQVWRLAA